MEQGELGKSLLRKAEFVALHAHRLPEFLGEAFSSFHKAVVNILQSTSTDYRLWSLYPKYLNSIMFRHG